MTKKIMQIGSILTEFILESYDKEYLHSVFGGIIDIDDLVDQVIFECIKNAFDSTEEKHSLRYYFKINGDESKEDVRMRFSRLMDIVKDAKKKELEYLKAFGVDVNEESIPKNMDSISDKIDGYKLSEMNFFEINNVGELELIKAVINHRITDTKRIKNARFKEIATQYDKTVLSWKELV